MADESRGGCSDAASGNGDDWLSALTPREREVLKLYAECRNTKCIAQRLGTRPQTVRNQLARIEQKLGVDSREELLVCILTRLGR